MTESGVTAKGQITLPKAVQEVLGVRTGDRVCYIIQDGEVRIRPVRPMSRLFGVVKYDGPPVSLEDMERSIAAGACKA